MRRRVSSRTGATTNAVTTDNRAARPPCWLKLVRRGGTITAYRSGDGSEWQVVGSESIALSDPIYIGLAVASRMQAMSNLSIFDNVSVDGG